jgi:hypothetical protein
MAAGADPRRRPVSTEQFDRLAHLWAWRPDRGEWTHCGTGNQCEMQIALVAATQASAALGLRVDYRIAADEPAPLHPARRITVDLPAPRRDGGALFWDGPDYVVEIDERGSLAAEAPQFEARTPDEVDAWRAFAAAVLAATQYAPAP